MTLNYETLLSVIPSVCGNPDSVRKKRVWIPDQVGDDRGKKYFRNSKNRPLA